MTSKGWLECCAYRHLQNISEVLGLTIEELVESNKNPSAFWNSRKLYDLKPIIQYLNIYCMSSMSGNKGEFVEKCSKIISVELVARYRLEGAPPAGVKTWPPKTDSSVGSSSAASAASAASASSSTSGFLTSVSNSSVNSTSLYRPLNAVVGGFKLEGKSAAVRSDSISSVNNTNPNSTATQSNKVITSTASMHSQEQQLKQKRKELQGELLEAGFNSTEITVALNTYLPLGAFYQRNDTSRLLSVTFDTLMCFIISKREMALSAPPPALPFLQTTGNKPPAATTSTTASDEALREIQMMDRVILESEKEKDEIQKRKRKREEGLERSSYEEISQAVEFNNSILLHGFPKEGGQSSSSSEKKMHASVFVRHAISDIPLIMNTRNIRVLLEDSVKTLAKSLCVRILLIESKALKWWQENSHHYIFGIGCRLDKLYEEIVTAAEAMVSNAGLSDVRLSHEQCTSILNLLEVERNLLESSLFEMPAIPGSYPKRFMIINARLKNVLKNSAVSTAELTNAYCEPLDASALNMSVNALLDSEFDLEDDGFEITEIRGTAGISSEDI